MPEKMEQRINSMLNGDRLWAWVFVIGLWLTYAFVFFSILAINTDTPIKIALGIGGFLVVIYNTASITAMISHYKEDKSDIYTIDIQHLDQIKANKAAQNRTGTE